MRRVLGWADARAYDATMTTEHSAAASVVVPSRIDHLCAQLEAPAGSAALVVPATAWRVRVITHFLVTCCTPTRDHGRAYPTFPLLG